MNSLFGCRLRIKKESAGLYSAEAFNFSPSQSWVKPEWATSTPMCADDLIRELLALGYHQIDIGDAFYEADPDWLSKKVCAELRARHPRTYSRRDLAKEHKRIG